MSLRQNLERIRAAKFTSKTESFNGYLLKYLPKRVKFRRTHEARVWVAINDWNKGQGVPEYQEWRTTFMCKLGII